MTVPPTFDRDGLAAVGFTGFVPFAAIPGTPRPREPGVYAVVREPVTVPKFLDRSVAGHFKGKDPTVDPTVLADKWVDGAAVLYFGKAGDLSKRLGQYAAIGRGQPVGHWGGRYVWQLADHGRLLVAWLPLPGGTDPFDAERELLEAFAAEHGALPFANIVRGRAPTAPPIAVPQPPDRIAALQGAFGGRVYRDVAVCTDNGEWPEGTADHRIDAVVLPHHPEPGVVAWDDDPDGFADAVVGTEAWVAVTRGYVDRPLIGWLLGATDMLSRSHPGHGLLRQAAVAEKVEPNAAWLYDRRGIRIVRA